MTTSKIWSNPYNPSILTIRCMISSSRLVVMKNDSNLFDLFQPTDDLAKSGSLTQKFYSHEDPSIFLLSLQNDIILIWSNLRFRELHRNTQSEPQKTAAQVLAEKTLIKIEITLHSCSILYTLHSPYQKQNFLFFETKIELNRMTTTTKQRQKRNIWLFFSYIATQSPLNYAFSCKHFIRIELINFFYIILNCKFLCGINWWKQEEAKKKCRRRSAQSIENDEKM